MTDASDIQDLAPNEAMAVDWPDDRYHSDTATVSRSQLVELLDRPSLFAAKAAGVVMPAKPTKALTFGRALHQAALEPDRFRARMHEIKSEDLINIMGIATGIHGHPAVYNLFHHPYSCEQTTIWRTDEMIYEVDGEPRSGSVLVRVREDAVFDLGDTAIILDIKTSADPSPRAFARSCARYRYYLQAALYHDAVAALHKDRDVHFIFAAVAKTAPWECACYDLSPEALELGRNQYRAAMIDLLCRRESGDWTADWQRSIHTLELPKWAYKDQT